MMQDVNMKNVKGVDILLAVIFIALITFIVCQTISNIKEKQYAFENGYEQQMHPGSSTKVWVKAK